MKAEDRTVDATLHDDVALSYRTYFPAGYSDGSDPLPLLVYLHGSGETGTDLDRLEKAGLPRYLANGLEAPFVVVCPQCEETWDPSELEVLLRHVVKEFNVDRSRLYLCGVSLGAQGTWLFSNVVADRFAAIVAICGPAVRIEPERYRELPVCCIHGAMDSVVPIGESVKMVRALRSAGCEVRFDVHADVDHDVWKHCFNDDLWSWLLTHFRSSSKS